MKYDYGIIQINYGLSHLRIWIVGLLLYIRGTVSQRKNIIYGIMQMRVWCRYGTCVYKYDM